jgi:formiminotetrahydrofolate cyclodeaminase
LAAVTRPSPSTSLLDRTARDLLDRFAAGTTTPGAGSAAALSGALAASLVEAVARYTVQAAARSERLAGFQARAAAILEEARTRSERLRSAVDEDAAAFERFWQLHRQGTRDDEALRLIIDVPLRIAEDCAAVAELAVELFDHGFRNARGEAAAAALGAIASGQSALYAARLNLMSAGTAPWVEERNHQVRTFQKFFVDLRERVEARGGGSA